MELKRCLIITQEGSVIRFPDGMPPGFRENTILPDNMIKGLEGWAIRKLLRRYNDMHADCRMSVHTGNASVTFT
jgi:hypothetical protein